jgi:hypothetical protein
MTVDMKALKEAAEKAGGREWFVDSKLDDGTLSGMHPFTAEWHEARFIAIANPSTILSLIERCEELEGALRPFADTYRAKSDPGTADLYDEQPQAWHVPLGAWRGASRAAPRLSKADATS